MTQQRSSFYRPDLDVVRFFAFLAVFFHHLLSTSQTIAPWHSALIAAFSSGLPLFFTLSAYLITLLLLREKSVSGSIHLRQFYQRRMLRIWPLYFAALLFGFAMCWHWHQRRYVLPWFLAAMLMGGNLLTIPATIVGHLWSISVEEQFYVFWPTLMRRLSRRGMIVAATLLFVLAAATLTRFGLQHRVMDIEAWAASFINFACFGAGILLALFDDRLPRLNAALSTLTLLAAAACWYISAYAFGIKLSPDAPGSPLALCCGYALVILGSVFIIVAAPGIRHWPASFIYLGKISYGLYVFHIPMATLASFLAPRLANPLHIAFTLALTIAAAALSYQFFESPFLRLKRKLEIIKTRPV